MQKIIHEYTNINKLFDYIDSLYYETSNIDKPQGKTGHLISSKYPTLFKNVLLLFKEYGYNFNLPLSDIMFDPVNMELFPSRKDVDNCVLVCASGGKDSTATILHYVKQGYKVFLYHMMHINKCYPDEYQRVQDIGNYLGADVLIDNATVIGNHMYVEHPLKNFILLNGAIHKALSLGIKNIAVGDFDSATLANNSFEVSGGDCKELWKEYIKIIQTILPNFDILMPLGSANDSLEAFLDNKDLLALTQSCMGTYRFREYKRQENISKFNVDIMPHRCGSCWKCALEYIYYADHDVLEFNEAYYKYCLDVLLRDMKSNGLVPFTPEFIWYNYFAYDITDSKIYEELKHALVQSRKIKYNPKEIAREILSTPVLSD